jgi:hypothetical protein
MAYYKFTWERQYGQITPVLEVKSILLDSTEKTLTDNNFPFCSSKTLGDDINSLNDSDISAVTYKITSSSTKNIYELVVDITPGITQTKIKVGYNGSTDSYLYVIGESITYPPINHTIFTSCSPIITTTTTTTSTTTTTTVAP